MTRGIDRRGFLAAGGAALLGLAGCSGRSGTDGAGDGPGDGGTTSAATGEPSPGTDEPADWPTPTDPPATVPLASERLPTHHGPAAVRERIVNGGPPKDGIPSVDDPSFESPAAAAEWLDPGGVVFGVARGGDARAYPQGILAHHEIVNDVLDGDPVAVTYCPLTGTAMGFERGETTFGVSGDLVNSNLVMYDRATDSRWPQMLATAVEGPYAGGSLREFPVAWTTLAAWRTAHPDTAVLSRDTGYARNYANDPYGGYNPRVGYYDSNRLLFPALETADRDAPGLKEVVSGVRVDGVVAAFLKRTLRETGVRSTAADGGRLVAVHDPALDVARVYRNPDGATVEPDNSSGGRPADGSAAGVVRVDGDAHPPDDLPLPAVRSFDAMWFAWYGFYPDGTLVV